MSAVTVTAKIQILPDADAEAALSATMDVYRKACDCVSEYIFRTHDMKQASVNKALYRRLREEFRLRSQMAQSVIKTVIAKYRTILSNGDEWTLVRFRRPQYDLVWNRDYSLLKDGTFSVNSLGGRLRVSFFLEGMEKYFDGTWMFGTAKLITKHGKWYLYTAVTRDFPELDAAGVKNVEGVDLGINFLASTYDSKGKSEFYSGRAVKQKRAHYKALRRDLQRRQTPSARHRLRQIGSRENRWMQDVNHCVSKALVKHAPEGTLFVLEDLTGVREATERVALKHRYETVSWAFFDLRKKIEYKAAMHGDNTLIVDPRYTSQQCPKCGHIEKGNRDRKSHAFCCRACGYRSNDDRIGAMNLHARGIEYLRTVAVG